MLYDRSFRKKSLKKAYMALDELEANYLDGYKISRIKRMSNVEFLNRCVDF